MECVACAVAVRGRAYEACGSSSRRVVPADLEADTPSGRVDGRRPNADNLLRLDRGATGPELAAVVICNDSL